MTYQELLPISNSIRLDINTLPMNSFIIAEHLGLTLKNSTQCKVDYQGKSPLINANAIYALNNGEYVIYYDENYAYRNFAIAHEIAHHLLGHKSDGAIQHHDANLLAAMLVAPEELILTNNIKTAPSLAEICKIPIATAIQYWNDLGIEEVVSTNDYLNQIQRILKNISKMIHNIESTVKGGVAI